MKRTLSPLCFLPLLFWLTFPVCAQTKEEPEYLITANGSTCEIFGAAIAGLGTRVNDKKEKVFVIASLGDGEISEQITQARLNQVKGWFEGYTLKTETLIMASGARVKGKGQVKIYVGNTYYILGYAPKNALLCIGEKCEIGCNKPIKLKRQK